MMFVRVVLRPFVGHFADACALLFRYLATGASQAHLAFSFRVGHSTVGSVLRETMQGIWQKLVPIVMPPPTEQLWRDVAGDFCKLWHCPNCIGAVDGKHIKIQAPPNSGSCFYNYKGYFSIILLAICNANYKFILVDIGDNGRHSDGGVFAHSEIGMKFKLILSISLQLKFCQAKISRFHITSLLLMRFLRKSV